MFKLAFIFIDIMIVIGAINGAASINNRLNLSDQISSEDIMKNLNAGEDIYFDHIQIIGDLNFDVLKKDQYNRSEKHLIINNTIRIINSEIDGIINISDANFSKDVLLMHNSFAGKVEVKNSKFRGKFAFSENQLNGEASFNDNIFENDVYLQNSIFHERASFENSDFHKTVYINSACFKKYANFQSAIFDDYADFKNVEFKKRADFHKTMFKGRAEFNNAIFAEQAFFSKSTFCGNATFTGADFEGNAKFWGARFLEDAKFSEATFNKIVYFNANSPMDGPEFNGDLNLSDTYIRSIYLENANFKKRISLNNSDFNKLAVEWSLIKGPIYYNGQVFQNLIRNFRSQERFLDADQCYFDYRFISMDDWLDYLSLISCGFGIRPHYTLAFSVVLIIIFGLLFGFADNFKKITTDCDESQSMNLRNKSKNLFKDLGDGLLFSLLVFTFQTRNGRKTFGIYQLFSILEGILGLILFALFTVTLANIMIRY